MLIRRKAFAIRLAFAAAHCGILCAGFFAPYAPGEQHREYAYAPPTQLRFVDDEHQIHLRPFIYQSTPVDGFQYVESRNSKYPIHFLVRKRDGLHLLAVDAPANLFLAGTDGYGRDIFSRLLFGGRTSLLAAAAATLGACLIEAHLTWCGRGAWPSQARDRGPHYSSPISSRRMCPPTGDHAAPHAGTPSAH